MSFVDGIGLNDWNLDDDTTDLNTLPVDTMFLVTNGGWRGRIVMMNGVKSYLIEDTQKTYPITGNEGFIIEILNDVPRLKISQSLTVDMIEGLQRMARGGHISDEDVEDFCAENNVSRKVVYHYLAVLYAPEKCKRCKFVEMYPSMTPCEECKTGKENHFTEE